MTIEATSDTVATQTEPRKILLVSPDDFHVHFRRGPMLRGVVGYTAAHFARAMVMPNTSPRPILNADDVIDYYDEITAAVAEQKMPFKPLMTVQITDDTTPALIRDLKRVKNRDIHVVAGKVYPFGVTTNSHNGVSDFPKLYPVFEMMQNEGLVLSLHGQKPGMFCLDREKGFLPHLEAIVKNFPGLRIVLEHISTKDSVDLVLSLPDTVAATVTAHHLVLTLDDVLCSRSRDGTREGLEPHHYCQPIPQRPEDREAIVAAVMSGNRKFFFGSDSAPHLQENKETSCGCAGVFSAPVALSVLADLFWPAGVAVPQHQSLLTFAQFVNSAGTNFYKLMSNPGTITLVQSPWVVPDNCNGVVPFRAGQTANWKVM